MGDGRIAELSRRGGVAVRGADAETFLNDLITSAGQNALGPAAFAALARKRHLVHN